MKKSHRDCSKVVVQCTLYTMYTVQGRLVMEEIISRNTVDDSCDKTLVIYVH